MEQDGNIYAVWSIYLSRSINNGDNWISPLALAPGSFGLNALALNKTRTFLLLVNPMGRKLFLYPLFRVAPSPIPNGERQRSI